MAHIEGRGGERNYCNLFGLRFQGHHATLEFCRFTLQLPKMSLQIAVFLVIFIRPINLEYIPVVPQRNSLFENLNILTLAHDPVPIEQSERIVQQRRDRDYRCSKQAGRTGHYVALSRKVRSEKCD
jgi:hypothetical protein